MPRPRTRPATPAPSNLIIVNVASCGVEEACPANRKGVIAPMKPATRYRYEMKRVSRARLYVAVNAGHATPTASIKVGRC